MATHSSIFAWRIPETGEPGGLPSMGLHSRTRLKRLSSSSIPYLVACELPEDRDLCLLWSLQHSQHLETTSSGLDTHLCSPGTWRLPLSGCSLPFSYYLLFSVSLPHCTSRSLRVLRQVHISLILQHSCIFQYAMVKSHTPTNYRCGCSIPEDLKDTGGRCSDVALVAQSLTLSCLCTNVTLEVKFSWVWPSKPQTRMLPHPALFSSLFSQNTYDHTIHLLAYFFFPVPLSQGLCTSYL